MDPWEISNSFQNCMHEFFRLRVAICKSFPQAMKHSMGTETRAPNRTIFFNLFCPPRGVFQFLQVNSLRIVGYFRKNLESLELSCCNIFCLNCIHHAHKKVASNISNPCNVLPRNDTFPESLLLLNLMYNNYN